MNSIACREVDLHAVPLTLLRVWLIHVASWRFNSSNNPRSEATYDSCMHGVVGWAGGGSGPARIFGRSGSLICSPRFPPFYESYLYKVETHRYRVSLFHSQEHSQRRPHAVPTHPSAMGPSTWPETEISPRNEDTLLQAARLRPFGVNYLQGGKLTAAIKDKY